MSRNLGTVLSGNEDVWRRIVLHPLPNHTLSNDFPLLSQAIIMGLGGTANIIYPRFCNPAFPASSIQSLRMPLSSPLHCAVRLQIPHFTSAFRIYRAALENEDQAEGQQEECVAAGPRVNTDARSWGFSEDWEGRKGESGEGRSQRSRSNMASGGFPGGWLKCTVSVHSQHRARGCEPLPEAAIPDTPEQVCVWTTCPAVRDSLLGESYRIRLEGPVHMLEALSCS